MSQHKSKIHRIRYLAAQLRQPDAADSLQAALDDFQAFMVDFFASLGVSSECPTCRQGVMKTHPEMGLRQAENGTKFPELWRDCDRCGFRQAFKRKSDLWNAKGVFQVLIDLHANLNSLEQGLRRRAKKVA